MSAFISRSALCGTPNLGIPVNMLMKISRPKMYVASITTYLFAFESAPTLDSWVFWLGLIYVTFPFNLFLMGWNDIEDYDVDVRNPRKVSFYIMMYPPSASPLTAAMGLFTQGGSSLYGALATPHQLRVLPLYIMVFNLPFFAAFLFELETSDVGLW